MNIRYVVKDEHTLGYIEDREVEYPLMHVLSSNKDGHYWVNGAVSVFGSAKEEDFATFRVRIPSNYSKSQ